MRDWKGRRVWIVGASSGIGAALARRLGTLGARLALSARRETPLRALLADAPTPGLALPLDVVDADAVAAAAARIDREWGGVDLVVWLAGRYVPMRAQDFDLGQARTMLAANLEGVLNGIDAVIPMLRRQGHGGIALVASVAGYRGLPKSLVYGPTKAALINLAEALYLDLAPDRLGVWLVSPGFVDTPMTAANDFRMPALVDPEQAAQAIIYGFGRGAFEIRFPRRFTSWMQLLRVLPHRAYFAAVRRFTGL
ncbi:MAG: SDR family NAD(P)-dependent oxidoreductase [Burkholderiaceae bacterium]